MIPSDMENFALSLRKFLLMPSYYTHQEKLFDMCYGVYDLHGNHATRLTPCFIPKTPGAVTLLFLQHLDLKISEFV